MREEAKIRANAELVVRTLGSVSPLKEKFGYDRASLAWVDEYIERSRRNSAPGSREKIAQIIGCYLGECVIAQFGGEWRNKENEWGVFFDDSNGIFPLNK